MRLTCQSNGSLMHAILVIWYAPKENSTLNSLSLLQTIHHQPHKSLYYSIVVSVLQDQGANICLVAYKHNNTQLFWFTNMASHSHRSVVQDLLQDIYGSVFKI